MIKSPLYAFVNYGDNQSLHIYSAKDVDYDLLSHLVLDVADRIIGPQQYNIDLSLTDNVWLDDQIPRNELFVGYVANVWARDSNYKGGAHFVSHDYRRLLGVLQEAYGDLQQYTDDYSADVYVRTQTYVIG